MEATAIIMVCLFGVSECKTFEYPAQSVERCRERAPAIAERVSVELQLAGFMPLAIGVDCKAASVIS